VKIVHEMEFGLVGSSDQEEKEEGTKNPFSLCFFIHEHQTFSLFQEMSSFD
jgi:hypothetical protein